ncbi:hypothetical protein S83_001535, partial [Arachis hypogaea]
DPLTSLIDTVFVGHIVHISSSSKKEIATFLKKVTSQEPNLHVVDIDLPLIGTGKESDSDFVQNVISRANMEKRL